MIYIINNYNLKKRLANIIIPYHNTLMERYSNNNFIKIGSRYVNRIECPLCVKYLRGMDCTMCPLGIEFGIGHELYGRSRCKVIIEKPWGPFIFKDYPSCIISSLYPNKQIENIGNWLKSLRE